MAYLQGRVRTEARHMEREMAAKALTPLPKGKGEKGEEYQVTGVIDQGKARERHGSRSLRNAPGQSPLMS